jgi:hypothetical protein
VAGRKNLSREDLAGLVFDVLMLYDTPIDLRQIAKEAGVDIHSARRGIGYIREIMADATDQPIVYIPPSRRSPGGYKFAMIERDVYPYIRFRYSIALKQLERLRTATTSPAMRKFAVNGIPPRALDDLALDIGRVEEDIARLLKHLPSG